MDLRTVPLAVAPRKRPRPSLAGTIAVVAILGLLAAGFGVLGGRPSASPSLPVGGEVRSEQSSAPGATAGPTPLVTPFSACAEAPTARPEVQLQVNGVPTPGMVEVLQWLDAATAAPDPLATPQAPLAPVPVPVDVITEVWIVGGACAIGWDIGLIGNQVLTSFVNPTMNPDLALQNRFLLTLAPFGGRDMHLRADLFFPTLIARATWPIRVGTVDRPVAELRNGDREGALVEGCDVVLTLGNGYQYPSDPVCLGDMPSAPTSPLEIGRDDRLEFRLGDWDVQGAVLTCGRLSETSFIVEPEPGCYLEASQFDQEPFATFPPLPVDIEGAWTIQISACARAATNNLCGSWYANIEIGD